jgi:hypothetical protein
MGLSAPLHGFGRLLARLPGACRRPVRRIVRHTRWVLAGLLCLAAAHLCSRHAEDLAAWQHGKARLQAAALPQYPHYAELGRRLQALPDSAILMTRNPWQMLFYAPDGLRAVGLPYATPDVLFGVARHYGVTHLVWDKNRPGLREFILSGHPALRRVIDKPYPVYAIDYTRFAPGELTDPAAAPPAPVWRADAPRPAGPRHPARAR